MRRPEIRLQMVPALEVRIDMRVAELRLDEARPVGSERYLETDEPLPGETSKLVLERLGGIADQRHLDVRNGHADAKAGIGAHAVKVPSREAIQDIAGQDIIAIGELERIVKCARGRSVELGIGLGMRELDAGSPTRHA